MPDSNEAKLVTLDRVLEIPRLETLQATAVSGPLAGCCFKLQWDGHWECVPTQSVELETLRGDFELTSVAGRVTVRKALGTGIDSNGTVRGVSVEIVLAGAAKDPRFYRSYIRVDASYGDRICFPSRIYDNAKRWMAVAHLPLRLKQGLFDLYFLKDGPYVILESEGTHGLDAHVAVCAVIRNFVAYLTARRLDRPSLHLALETKDGGLGEARWHAGRGRKDHIYAAIPSEWSEWVAAREKFALGNQLVALDPDVVARCVERLLDERGLETCMEYLAAFPEAPVEMRGALLSVALEALTDHLENKGLITSVKPMQDKAEWRKLRKALLDLLGSSVDPKVSPEQLEIFESRVNNLNKPTNRDKLTQPFKVLGLSLSDEDIDTIDKRNIFLHDGRIIDAEAASEDPDAWMRAYVVEMRLLTVVNRLFLKYLGFAGPLIDWGARGLAADKPLFVLLETTPAPTATRPPSETPATR